MSAIKLLYASHYLMHKVGATFCSVFISEEFDNITNLSKSKSTLGIVFEFLLFSNKIDSVYAVMTSNYYSFLVCYANCFKDIQTLSRTSMKDIVASIKNNENKYLLQLIMFKNIVRYVTMVIKRRKTLGFLIL